MGLVWDGLRQRASSKARTAKGLSGLMAIAPFRILITAASEQDPVWSTWRSIYQDLQKAGDEPLLDDRDLRMGFKLKDSDEWHPL